MTNEKRTIQDLAQRLEGASYCETNPRYAEDLTSAAAINDSAVPPPKISVAHSCQSPVVPVDCFYTGPKNIYLTQKPRAYVRRTFGTPRGAQGVNHHSSKLTEEKVREMRSDWSKLNCGRRKRKHRLTFKALGEKYGVSCQTASKVVRKQIWKHVV